MTERVPQVGDIVHLRHQGRCFAVIVVTVDERGTELQPFPPMGQSGVSSVPRFEPYNSLTSARPTSGWHWKEEHDQANPPT